MLLEEVANNPSIPAEKQEEARSLQAELKRIFIAIYALIAASIIGVGGMVMVYLGRPWIAAALLGLPVLLPGVLVPKSLILSFPLVIAGGLCFKLEAAEPESRKKKRRRPAEDEDAEDDDAAPPKRKKKGRDADEDDADDRADRKKRKKGMEARRRPRQEEEEDEEEQAEDEEPAKEEEEAEDEDEVVESEAVEEEPAPAPIMQVTCPHCKSTLKSKTPLPVGKAIKCPKCTKVVRIESPKPASPTAPKKRAPVKDEE